MATYEIDMDYDEINVKYEAETAGSTVAVTLPPPAVKGPPTQRASVSICICVAQV